MSDNIPKLTPAQAQAWHDWQQHNPQPDTRRFMKVIGQWGEEIDNPLDPDSREGEAERYAKFYCECVDFLNPKCWPPAPHAGWIGKVEIVAPSWAGDVAIPPAQYDRSAEATARYDKLRDERYNYQDAWQQSELLI